MIFDQKLTWKDHTRSLIQECHETLGLLKTLAHHHWGSNSEMPLRLYKSLIVLSPLNSLHNSALRIATGAFRTTPVTSFYCLAAEPSLLLLPFAVLGANSKLVAQVTGAAQLYNANLGIKCWLLGVTE
ncbi:hypothetical protein Zmor_024322 [Zophobas morio]|uniref:Uncharacterized protein n=1 Tax=Zophobas morio TaxID=2755281 RepID=A0AA38M877_9CUCU|nr:hypothetical protein Zmor_024322 [Zophobas morio]